MRVFLGSATDRGRVRTNNEDSLGCWTSSEAPGSECVCVVADGVGGAQAGEKASREAVDVFLATFSANDSRPMPDRMKVSVSAANEAVSQSGVADHRGTTLVAAGIAGARMHGINVGDSRLYLVRDGVPTQISHDHSWVEEQVRAGLMSEESAKTSPYRNVVTRWVGGGPVEPDLFDVSLQHEDRLVLCSDGLTRHVTDSTIAEVASRLGEKAAADELVRLALAGGGSDNVTVIVVRVADDAELKPTTASNVTSDDTIDRTADIGAIESAVRPLRPPLGSAVAAATMVKEPRAQTRRSFFRAASLIAIVMVLLVALGGAAFVFAGKLDGSLNLDVEAAALATAVDGTLYVVARDSGEILAIPPEATGDLTVRLLGAEPRLSSRWSPGEPGVSPASLSAVSVAPDGQVFVADANANRIRRFTRDGQFAGEFGTSGPGAGGLDQPSGIAATTDGHVWVLDSGGQRIQLFDLGGQLVRQIEPPLRQSVALSVDAKGRLFVADPESNEIVHCNADGEPVDRIPIDGDSTVARISALAVSVDGRVFVIDAGRRALIDLGDGTGAAGPPIVRALPTSVREPSALAVGRDGTVFVLDSSTARISVLPPRDTP